MSEAPGHGVSIRSYFLVGPADLQPGLSSAACRVKHAVTLSLSGISDEQNFKASLRQARFCSSVAAWLAVDIENTEIANVTAKLILRAC
jgi:hypothetical protein